MKLSLWGFAVWIVFIFTVSGFLTAQNTNHRSIASAKINGSYTDEKNNESDLQLAGRINSVIQGCVFYSVYDYVTGEVSDGTVLLKGWTHEQWIADLLVKKISKIEGIKNIDNQIQPASGSDDLARRAVRAIYTDGLFEKYSFTSNPPVHVVVINNQIILAGEVATEIERNRAEVLVDFKTNAATVDNRLKIRP